MKKVLYVQYTNPAAYPPLEHSSQILARNGWQVLFVGVRSKATAELKFPAHSSIQERMLDDCEGGWRQKLHYLKFVCWSFYWMLRFRPQWVYASDLWSAPAALLMSFVPGTRVIYHEHDLHLPKQPTAFFRLCQKARSFLAAQAEACVLPNQERADLFKLEHPRAKVLCVWNCPTLEECSAPRTFKPNDEFWLLYHGSVVPQRLPRPVVHSLAQLPETVKLRVVGYEPPGHEGYLNELHGLASELGVADRLQFCKSVPERKALLDWSRQSNVGLAFVPRDTDDVNMKTMTGASNKAFDYLANGVALLVTNVSDWSGLFVKPGYGLACDPEDVDDLVAAINRFRDHPQDAAAMGESGRQRILMEWNYQAQFAPVLTLMNSAASSVPVTIPAKRSEGVSLR